MSVNKIKIVFTHDLLNYQHLNKSFVNIPKEISKIDNYFQAELVYFSNTKFNSDGIKLKNLGSDKFKLLRTIKTIYNLFLDRKNTKVLMLLHLTKITCFIALISKIICPWARIYLKLDINREFFKGELSLLNRIIVRLLLRISDVISYESISMKPYLESSKLFHGIINKLVYLPNCAPEAKSLPLIDYDKKEKLIINVGRLGSHQKNTELILNALEGIDLKDWTFGFIGEADEKIVARIERLSESKNVIYFGEIKDRYILLDFYKKSKLFVLSSRYEGFATVLVEAGLFGCVIASTDVNGACDVTDDFKLGLFFNSESELSKVLIDVIDSKIDVEKLSTLTQERVHNNFNLENAILSSGLLSFLHR